MELEIQLFQAKISNIPAAVRFLDLHGHSHHYKTLTSPRLMQKQSPGQQLPSMT